MTEVIILAAGKGTRMNSDLPKVLTSLNGRPMITYLLDSVSKLGNEFSITLVVSPDNINIMKEALKEYDVKYAVQKQQLGTGHAVLSAKEEVNKDADKVIVLYGDHPFIKTESIKELNDNHKKGISLMSVKLEDFSDWRKNFYHWGRLVRDDEGRLKGIVEYKDASDEQREITEVNPAIFCLSSKWLWDNIYKLKNENKQGEYYLTDLIKLAFEGGQNIESTPISAQEGAGINSQEELNSITKVLFE